MAVATKSASRPQVKPQPIEKTQTFKNLDLHRWKSRPDEGEGDDKKVFDRPYVIVTAPFAFVRRWIVSEPYDSASDTGWQRKTTPAHIKKLRIDMEADDFTPTAWYATADEWHIEHGLKYLPVEPGYHPQVNLTVNEDHKLRITDANHRFESLKLYRTDMATAERQDMVELIDQIPITIIVSLSPQHLLTDFLRLQKGKGVSRSQLKVMELKTRMLPSEKLEIIDMATKIARILDQDERSHLFQQIAFDTMDVKKGIQYSSLLADHGSSLAWTLYGGAIIALEYEKDAEWMANVYIETYLALKDTLDQDDGTKAFMKTNEKLCPESDGGSKGGSFLLLGVGNCLAFRLCYLGDDYLPDEDGERVELTAYKKLRGLTGGSAPDKRKDMNAFATLFFSDLKDRVTGRSIRKVGGIPADLVDITSFSTWGIDKDDRQEYQAAQKAQKAKKQKALPKKPRKTVAPKPVLTSEYEPDQVLANTEEE